MSTINTPIVPKGDSEIEVRRAFQRLRTLLKGTKLPEPVKNHQELNNLNWSNSGHTIDSTVDFSSNIANNVQEIRFPVINKITYEWGGALQSISVAKAYYKESADLTASPENWNGTEFDDVQGELWSPSYPNIAMNDNSYASNSPTIIGNYPLQMFRRKLSIHLASSITQISITVIARGLVEGGTPQLILRVFNYDSNMWETLDIKSGNGWLTLTTILSNNIENYLDNDDFLSILVVGPKMLGMEQFSLNVNYVAVETTASQISINGQKWEGEIKVGNISIIDEASGIGTTISPIPWYMGRRLTLWSPGATGTEAARLLDLRPKGTGAQEVRPLWVTPDYNGTKPFWIFNISAVSITDALNLRSFQSELEFSKTIGTAQVYYFSAGHYGRAVPVPTAYNRNNKWEVYGFHANMRIATTDTTSFLYAGWFNALNAHNAGLVVGVYGSAVGGGTNNSFAGYFDNGDVYCKNRLKVGSTGTPSHSFGPGSGWFTESLEVDGEIYCDGWLMLPVDSLSTSYSFPVAEGEIRCFTNVTMKKISVYVDGAWRDLITW